MCGLEKDALLFPSTSMVLIFNRACRSQLHRSHARSRLAKTRWGLQTLKSKKDAMLKWFVSQPVGSEPLSPNNKR